MTEHECQSHVPVSKNSQARSIPSYPIPTSSPEKHPAPYPRANLASQAFPRTRNSTRATPPSHNPALSPKRLNPLILFYNTCNLESYLMCVCVCVWNPPPQSRYYYRYLGNRKGSTLAAQFPNRTRVRAHVVAITCLRRHAVCRNGRKSATYGCVLHA